MSSTKKRIGAVVLGAALSASLLGVSGAAFAEDNFVDAGTIDTTQKGEIIVHKRIDAAGNTAGNIYTPESGQGELLTGSKFTAYKLDLDLTKNENWAKLATIPSDLVQACKNAQEPGASNEVAPGVVNTRVGREIDASANGVGSSGQIDIGAYLVCETQVPADALKAAAPFVVTVPAPAEKAGKAGWVYKVSVYPKNVKSDGLNKTITTDHKKLSTADGSHTFTLETKIPALATGDNFTYFQFADSLSEKFATNDGTSVKVYIDDQDVVEDHRNIVTDRSKNFLSVWFSKRGLATLKANAGKTLKVEFTAKVVDQHKVGEVTNVGAFAFDVATGDQPEPTANNNTLTPPVTQGDEPKKADDTPGKKIVSNTVKASWGELKLTKKSAGAGNPVLKGAEFEVYYTTLPAAQCKNDNKALLAPFAISDNQVNTGKVTTGQDGTVKVSGLKVDAKNDGNLNESACYVVKETAAPLGYVLPTGNDAYTAVVVKAEAATGEGQVINNTPSSVPNLPLTGANGQLLLVIGGSSLVLFALGGLLVARRRNAKN
ncbi:MAG: SpaH/EbpB family LPXTG-anchored major pilin [Actinomycetaceae bacterium]|nr:SpaH/EbpB family LPXTG-anchored major pilin [Actinomycetaceae bacterium]